jgi:prepilin peptidase CpaA
MIPYFLSAAAILVSLVAAATDLRSGLIPNKLTVAAMVVGLIAGGLAHGVMGLLASFCGLVVCAAVPGVVYKASQGRGIGGGDIKLFAALGALLGPTHGLEVELSAFLLLGVFALFRLAFLGQLGRVLLGTLRLMGRACVPGLKLRSTEPVTALTPMRMGPAIALGVVTTLALPYVTRWVPWLG